MSLSSPKRAGFAAERFRPATRRPLVLEIAVWVIVVSASLGAALSIYQAFLYSSEPSFALRLLPIAVLFGPPIWLALRARSGARWARVLILLGAALILVGSVISAIVEPISEGIDPAGIVIICLMVILIAAPPVMMWLPKANAYFRAVAEEKRRYLERQWR